MVLNELSLQTPATDIITARQWMSQLIQTIRTATRCGVKKVVRTHDNINTIELAPNYPVAKWRNDREVDREERRFLLTLITKSPYLIDVTAEIQDSFNLLEVFSENSTALGLGFALISDSLAISLCSHEKWDCDRVILDINTIDEDNPDELISEQREIVHSSRSIHISTHANWIKTRSQTRIKDGNELWQRRNELFPHLEFCDSVETQICSLQTGNPMLMQVKKRLFEELEEAAKGWTAAEFSLDSIPSKTTPESESRLKKFKTELTIRCPDGTNRLFSLHLRMTPGAWRLYFWPLKPGTIIVGYIGSKII
ncbi:MAG: hypothetical protein SAJ11_11965 [Jaaginema sp. PMC 1078.18]|nr:hypothetical protein [Jaaginema sp. PMC 1078.18]